MELNQKWTKEFWTQKLNSMFDPQWEIDYNNERKAKFEALLSSTYVPKNYIEKQLFKKAKEFATEQLAWLAAGANQDEGGSAAYDAWLEGFLTECGLPEDNYDSIEFDIRKPFPKEAFCRDSFTVHGFYEMTVEALVELADSLHEDWTPEPPPADDCDLVAVLLASTEKEVDETLYHTLFPTNETDVEDPKIDKVIQAFANSKNPLQRLFSVLLLCAVKQTKPAFLFSKSNFDKLLKDNELISRKSINNDYSKFLAYCFQKNFLKIEIDTEVGSRKSRLVSLDGQIKDLIALDFDRQVDQSIAAIVTSYKERSAKKNEKPRRNAAPDEIVSTTPSSSSDLALCEEAMSRSLAFNEKDKAMIPGIYYQVKNHGSFKGNQAKPIISFLNRTKPTS